MSQSTCPDPRNWQALLDEDDGDGALELAAHLETCADCQQTLETLVARPGGWEDAARGLEKGVRAEPAVRGLLEQLKREEYLPAEDDLSFLHPADQPGLLGMLGPYEVEAEIGRGAMGVVLKARDPALNRIVALKVLAPHLAASATARRRFVREGRAAAVVCHENVVTVHCVTEAAGLPYLVMHYLAGESLQERLDHTGPLQVEEIVTIGAQVAAGLAAAHAHQLIHRDIKPANILLEERGVKSVPGEIPDRLPCLPPRSPLLTPRSCIAKITDFGLARMADDVQMTQHGAVLGTPEYMAPEQARGERTDHRADLFSLGSVLYAMCTGQPPFRAASALAMLRQVSDAAPAPVRSLNPIIPAWLEALIVKLMQKDPDRRMQHAAEVAALLEGFLAHLRQPDIVPEPVLDSAASSARVAKTRRASPLVAGLALCLSALTFLTLLLLFQGEPRHADADKPPLVPQASAKEVYQDFRGQPPQPPEFRVEGPDLDAVTKAEEAGFRITLPKKRKAHRPVEIASTFVVMGDFEITGTYELLAADMPTDGYGVGVCLNVATTRDLHKFLKVSRVLRPTASVFMAEYWTKGADDWQGPQVPTEARSGQLRLVREGSRARCQASAGPGQEFMTILEKEAFGTEDMVYLRFQVTDGNKPGYAVDARLIDLRVRHGRAGQPHVAEPVTPPPSAPPQVASSPRSSPLRALLLVGILSIILLTAFALAWFINLRRRDSSKTPEPDVHNAEANRLTFACTACGKNLKIRAALAGKKLKCPHCGQVLPAPPSSITARRRS